MSPVDSSGEKSVVVLERQDDPRVWFQLHHSRAWIVYLNDKAIGRLPEGGKLTIPLDVGTHSVNFQAESSLATLPIEPGIYLTIPEDLNHIIRIGAENSMAKGIYIVESRQIPEDQAEMVKAAVNKDIGVAKQSELATTSAVADMTGNFKPKPKIKFSEMLWQRAAILFCFYWFFRWVVPSLLPYSLRNLDIKTSLFPCIFLGLIWTGVTLLVRLGAKSEQNNTQ